MAARESKVMPVMSRPLREVLRFDLISLHALMPSSPMPVHVKAVETAFDIACPKHGSLRQ